MGLVVDAAITLAWAFDEVDAKASEARERLQREDAVVPGLWWFEVRNGLVIGERRGLLTERSPPRKPKECRSSASLRDSTCP
jgi:hypothetical protein